ncbi:hypothetical protein GCM10027610_081870 [Dactylosporangium cerinum]
MLSSELRVGGIELVEQGVGEAYLAICVVGQCEDDEAGPLVGDADELVAQAGPAAAVAVDAAPGVGPEAEAPCVVEGGAVVEGAGCVQQRRDAQFVGFEGLIPADQVVRGRPDAAVAEG